MPAKIVETGPAQLGLVNSISVLVLEVAECGAGAVQGVRPLFFELSSLACPLAQAEIVCGTSFRGRGDASVGICNEKSSCKGELDGAHF